MKELLFAKYRDGVIAYRSYWKEQGVDVKIQDFKGEARGKSKEEYGNYIPIDHFLVSSEYKHRGIECCCAAGCKNVLVRGFDMLDVFPQGGDVVCWHDPTVVGNIIEDWYEPDYRITKDSELGRYDVKGVPKLYRGTYERDMWEPPKSACGD